MPSVPVHSLKPLTRCVPSDVNRISPEAQRMAAINDIDGWHLQSSGSGGVTTKQDLLNHLAAIIMGKVALPSIPVDESHTATACTLAAH